MQSTEQLIIIIFIGVIWLVHGGNRAKALASPTPPRSWEERKRSPDRFSEPRLRRLAYLAELTYIAFYELWGIAMFVSALSRLSSASLSNETTFLIDLLFVTGAIAGIGHQVLKYTLKRQAKNDEKGTRTVSDPASTQE